MKLYSTNNQDQLVDFKTAVFNSMPLDKGLYMPVDIPRLDAAFLNRIDQYSLQDIAFEVASALIGDSMPATALKSIITDALSFEAPLQRLDSHTQVLELFHGPSLAFKDFGARFMSRVMSYFLEEGEQMLDVLVATSGDTGGAVALGFLGVPNTRVTILFPKGKVSEIQELQLCTNGQNIHVLEIDGTFDDCQRLVKEAFADAELNARLRLTSANSINIARLIPQTFYYFNAYAQLRRQGVEKMVVAVPSGNFGNIAAGLLAQRMGLPITQFIAATNINDTVPRFLETGVYETRPSVQTYANAMDVGAPSNWVRIMELFKGDLNALKAVLNGYRFTDEETISAIKTLWEQHGYIACPHTAIAWLATQAYQAAHPGSEAVCVFLSTAHPCKFPDALPQEVASKIVVPEAVKGLKNKQRQATAMTVDFPLFKEYLLNMPKA
ncbi:threonine synthase [Pedobacter sp. SAFR-022]|uniref:threonine synthase n=1 Tax=Pedobacter sp. SAFR-022 TaxID=3436861 RepID=UPI003F7F8759